jgi:hypothetical protein
MPELSQANHFIRQYKNLGPQWTELLRQAQAVVFG